MAQSGFTPIITYNSGTTTNVPTAGNLANGELALNYADMKLYAKNGSGVVTLLASAAGATGTVSSVAATVPSFLSISGSPITTSGTLAISLSGTALPTTSGGTGLTSFTANGVVYASSTSALATGSALTFDGTNFTTPRVLFGGSTLPAAGNPSIALRTSDNTIYHQSGSANTITFLDSSQNTMQSIGATANIFNISNSEQMRLTSAGLGIGTSSPNIAGVAKALTVNGSDAILEIANAGVLRASLYGNSSGGALSGVGSTGLRFYTSASGATTLALTIDTAQNVGIGVTPSAWSGFKALQVGASSAFADFSSSGNRQTSILNNAYFNGSNYIYTNSDPATYYKQTGGQHQWYNAISGTATNPITFIQAMTLDNSGNLLIGTTTSTYSNTGRVCVELNGSTDSLIAFKSGGTSSGYLQGTSGTLSLFASGASTPLVFGTNGAERARIDTSGNVGIGTSSPSYKLDVNGQARISTGLTLSAATSSLYSTDGTLSYYDSGNGVYLNGTNSGWLALQASGSQATFIQLTGASYSTPNLIIFNTNSSERMRIDSSGNLGIGTTAPTQKLDVSGGSGAPVIALTTTGASPGAAIKLFGSASSYKNWQIGTTFTTSNGALEFTPSTTNGGSTFSTPAVTFDSSGNLLVGTTSTNPTAGIALINNNTAPDIRMSHASGTSSGSYFMEFNYNQSGCGSITQNGSSAVLYNVTSDQRLKTNIVDAPDGNIDQIKIRSFDWKSDGTHNTYGVIAQELLEVAPYAVHQPANPDEMMGVDYSKLVPMMIKEIQQLKAEVAKLKGV
jgi:hypothetical protein